MWHLNIEYYSLVQNIHKYKHRLLERTSLVTSCLHYNHKVKLPKKKSLTNNSDLHSQEQFNKVELLLIKAKGGIISPPKQCRLPSAAMS